MNHIKQIEVEEMQLGTHSITQPIININISSKIQPQYPSPISSPSALVTHTSISQQQNQLHRTPMHSTNAKFALFASLYLLNKLGRNDIVKIAALRKAYWPNLLRIIMSIFPKTQTIIQLLTVHKSLINASFPNFNSSSWKGNSDLIKLEGQPHIHLKPLFSPKTLNQYIQIPQYVSSYKDINS